MISLAMTAAERGRRTGLLPQAMAAIIRGRIRGFGRCTPQDLLRDGFSAREILLNQKEAWSAAVAAGTEATGARRLAGTQPRGEEGGTPDRETTRLEEGGTTDRETTRLEEGGDTRVPPDRDRDEARRAQLAAVLAATRRPADAPDDGGVPVPLRASIAHLAALAGLGLFYVAIGGFCLAMGGAS